jgi:hypothetical protein
MAHLRLEILWPLPWPLESAIALQLVFGKCVEALILDQIKLPVISALKVG